MTALFAASTVQVVTHRVGSSWPWYIIRGAGFVAAGLIILLMLSGIGQVTGIIYRYIEPIKAWAIHKALALALCGAIVVHIGFLLIDKYVRFNIVQLLVPFASRYNNGTRVLGMPLGALAVTFGILSMYGVAIIVASSLGWIDTKKKTWKLLHYISYAVAFLIFLHAVYVGSDLKYGTFRMVWIAAGFVVLLGIAARLWRVRVIKKRTEL
jgi:predicted ferric reductase